MAKLAEGDSLPRFRYDTPYTPQNRVADLYREKPVFLVFLGNFGHPVTRWLLRGYKESWPALRGCGLACVVQSRPHAIAAALPEEALPFPIICDPGGELYRCFEIPTEARFFRYASLRALGILAKARKKGYRTRKDKPQQLPLTLLVDTGGVVRLAHYGASLTDLPESCAAMSATLERVLAQGLKEPAPRPKAPRPPQDKTMEIPSAESAELDSEGNPYTLESLFGVHH